MREFRRLDRVCPWQAALSTLDLARSRLLDVANDCRIAAEASEALELALSAARGDGRHWRRHRPQDLIESHFGATRGIRQAFAAAASRARRSALSRSLLA
ncbi:hypothetical protein WN72_25525 [Bradyrhizobium arachidis]|uniref:Uncharacterized protein n=1 Tax=Bradyrhizobium arachidis TaxID=858423 RepID=A0AAE7NRV7_9BRAD|nr:hypothetical protein WN72_25525 [Bradyrhizobium arachidis]